MALHRLLHFVPEPEFRIIPFIIVSIVGSLRDREVACSASDRQGTNFESCVWRRVSSQSSHHPQEVLLAQFSLYVHKGGLKPDSSHLPPFIIVIYLRYRGKHCKSQDLKHVDLKLHVRHYRRHSLELF